VAGPVSGTDMVGDHAALGRDHKRTHLPRQDVPDGVAAFLPRPPCRHHGRHLAQQRVVGACEGGRARAQRERPPVNAHQHDGRRGLRGEGVQQRQLPAHQVQRVGIDALRARARPVAVAGVTHHHNRHICSLRSSDRRGDHGRVAVIDVGPSRKHGRVPAGSRARLDGGPYRHYGRTPVRVPAQLSPDGVTGGRVGIHATRVGADDGHPLHLAAGAQRQRQQAPAVLQQHRTLRRRRVRQRTVCRGVQVGQR